MPSRSRRPRYASFLATGATVGLLATILVVLGPGADADRRAQLFFYLGLLLGGIGALLGGLSAVLLEGRHKSAVTPAPDDRQPLNDP